MRNIHGRQLCIMIVILKFIHVTVDVHQRNDIMLQGTWEEDFQPNDEAFEVIFIFLKFRIVKLLETLHSVSNVKMNVLHVRIFTEINVIMII